MEITANLVKELRDKTGSGFMDCKKALNETAGKVEEAVEYLRKKGLAAASKRAEKAVQEGIIGSYIHQGGKIGVLAEVNCETDFVAKTDDFQTLVRDIAMQVAASNPLYIDRDEIPEDLLEKEKDILRAQALESGKPEKFVDRIVDGRLEKFFSEVCLLEQPFIKEAEKSVRDHINSNISKLGENIKVKRFIRYKLGEEVETA